MCLFSVNLEQSARLKGRNIRFVKIIYPISILTTLIIDLKTIILIEIMELNSFKYVGTISVTIIYSVTNYNLCCRS